MSPARIWGLLTAGVVLALLLARLPWAGDPLLAAAIVVAVRENRPWPHAVGITGLLADLGSPAPVGLLALLRLLLHAIAARTAVQLLLAGPFRVFLLGTIAWLAQSAVSLAVLRLVGAQAPLPSAATTVVSGLATGAWALAAFTWTRRAGTMRRRGRAKGMR